MGGEKGVTQTSTTDGKGRSPLLTGSADLPCSSQQEPEVRTLPELSHRHKGTRDHTWGQLLGDLGGREGLAKWRAGDSVSAGNQGADTGRRRSPKSREGRPGPITGSLLFSAIFSSSRLDGSCSCKLVGPHSQYMDLNSHALSCLLKALLSFPFLQ